MIGNNAFFECKSLSSVAFLKEVFAIKDRAFESCSSLTSTVFKKGIESIGNKVFFNALIWNQ